MAIHSDSEERERRARNTVDRKSPPLSFSLLLLSCSSPLRSRSKQTTSRSSLTVHRCTSSRSSRWPRARLERLQRLVKRAEPVAMIKRVEGEVVSASCGTRRRRSSRSSRVRRVPRRIGARRVGERRSGDADVEEVGSRRWRLLLRRERLLLLLLTTIDYDRELLLLGGLDRRGVVGGVGGLTSSRWSLLMRGRTGLGTHGRVPAVESVLGL